MFRDGRFPSLAGMLALGACAVAVPTGPNVLVVPAVGKNLTQFQQEDVSCRGYAQQQIGNGVVQHAPKQSAVGSAATGTAAGAVGGGAAVEAGTGQLSGTAVDASNAAASAAELQWRYDLAYAQCMIASGDHLQEFQAGWAYGPYAYLYAPQYGPWFGPSIALGFVGRVGPHFHHPGFAHHDSHRS
jgi:hypothetical protein